MLTIRAAVLAGLCAAAVPAHAVTFASYTQVGTGRTFSFTNIASGARTNDATFASNTAGSTPAAVNVRFSFTQPGRGLSGLVSNLAATLRISGTVPRPNVTTGNLVQPGLNGTMTFLSSAPVTLSGALFGTTQTLAAGANLLTVTFSSGSITTSTGGNAGTLASTTVTYTSDFLDFGNGSNSLSVNLSSMSVSAQAAGNGALRSFRSQMAGSFSAAITPFASAAPEPASWAMLVMGFGLLGVAMRRRVRSVAA